MRVIGACADAIRKYHTLRQELFRQLVRLKEAGGGPWRIQYKRDPAVGDRTLRPRIVHHTATVHEISGQAVDAVAHVTEPETYASFFDFCLLNSEGKQPDPGTDLAKTEVNLAFLLEHLLASQKIMARALPQLQLGAFALNMDASALARLEIELPVFPYWPRSPKEMSESDFGAVIAAEKPLLDAAQLTLRMLQTAVASPQVSRQAATSANADCEKALQVLYQTGGKMEAHPSTFEGKDEEALSDHFITVLDSHFQSVTGESFNRQGRTDIMIRHQGVQVLISESKFWRGGKAFHDTIDQALGNLAPRDAHAAVLVFVRDKHFAPILEKIQKAAIQHPLCAGSGSERKRGWYVFGFGLRHDPTINVKLSVLCFHFPRSVKKTGRARRNRRPMNGG